MSKRTVPLLASKVSVLSGGEVGPQPLNATIRSPALKISSARRMFLSLGISTLPTSFARRNDSDEPHKIVTKNPEAATFLIYCKNRQARSEVSLHSHVHQ